MASLQRNVASQNFTFCMVSASTGAADASATVTVKVTKDNGTQTGGAGTVTNAGNGQYNYAPAQAETNAVDVGFLMTATGDIPVNVDFHTDPVNFASLAIDANGNVSVTSNVKKNVAQNGIMFVMRNATTGLPQTGLTVTSQRAIDGGSLVATTNSPTELGSGIYVIDLSAADMNGNHIIVVFTATNASTSFVEFWTQP